MWRARVGAAVLAKATGASRTAVPARLLARSTGCYGTDWGRKYNIVRRLFDIDDKKEKELVDANLAERKRLTSQGKHTFKAFFADFKEIRKNNGKRYLAPDTITKPSESPHFPRLELKTLGGKSVILPDSLDAKATLVLLGLRGYCKPMLEEYRAAWQKHNGSQRGCRIFELWMVESFIQRKFFAANIEKSCRDTLPDGASVDDAGVYLGGDCDALKSELDIFNSITGYAFLLDKKGRIRWKAHGHIHDEERVTLDRCVSELLASSR